MIINKKWVTSSASLGCRSFHRQDGSWLQGTACPVDKGIRYVISTLPYKNQVASIVLSEQNSTDLLYQLPSG